MIDCPTESVLSSIGISITRCYKILRYQVNNVYEAIKS